MSKEQLSSTRRPVLLRRRTSDTGEAGSAWRRLSSRPVPPSNICAAPSWVSRMMRRERAQPSSKGVALHPCTHSACERVDLPPKVSASVARCPDLLPRYTRCHTDTLTGLRVYRMRAARLRRRAIACAARRSPHACVPACTPEPWPEPPITFEIHEQVRSRAREHGEHRQQACCGRGDAGRLTGEQGCDRS